jgi:hypothetical protein
MINTSCVSVSDQFLLEQFVSLSPLSVAAFTAMVPPPSCTCCGRAYCKKIVDVLLFENEDWVLWAEDVMIFEGEEWALWDGIWWSSRHKSWSPSLLF